MTPFFRWILAILLTLLAAIGICILVALIALSNYYTAKEKSDDFEGDDTTRIYKAVRPYRQLRGPVRYRTDSFAARRLTGDMEQVPQGVLGCGQGTGAAPREISEWLELSEVRRQTVRHAAGDFDQPDDAAGQVPDAAL